MENGVTVKERIRKTANGCEEGGMERTKERRKENKGI